MDGEWEIDLDVADLGSMFTLLGTTIASAVMGASEITYTMLWITSAYERNGKDFFLDLLYASSYTWTAEYVITAGSMILVSSIIFLLTMTLCLLALNSMSREGKRPNMKAIFGLFFLGLLVLIVTLLSAIMLRYS